MFMVLSLWQSHSESSFDECRTTPDGRRPSDQAGVKGAITSKIKHAIKP